jgi:predicted transcriptional regulator
MKNRSRLEIVATILDIATDGALKTRIMYQAYLNVPQMKEYLAILMEADLLSYDPTAKIYTSTEKGKRFIQCQREMQALLPPVRKIIN